MNEVQLVSQKQPRTAVTAQSSRVARSDTAHGVRNGAHRRNPPRRGLACGYNADGALQSGRRGLLLWMASYSATIVERPLIPDGRFDFAAYPDANAREDFRFTCAEIVRLGRYRTYSSRVRATGYSGPKRSQCSVIAYLILGNSHAFGSNSGGQMLPAVVSLRICVSHCR